MILYRYRSLNDRTIDTIFNNYLYFSKPSSFNDPFDCHVSLTIEGTHYEKMEGAKELVGLDDLSGIARRKAKKKYLEDITNKRFDYDVIYKGIDEVMDKRSICCFSIIPDDLLMWAHYAEGHKGVCLQYDIAQDTLLDCILKPVIYQDNLIKSNLLKHDDDIFSVFTTKSTHWAYEQEYRLINRLGYQKIGYQRGCLKGITFGCKVDSDKKNNLINEIKAKGWFFKFYEAFQSREKYELTIAKF